MKRKQLFSEVLFLILILSFFSCGPSMPKFDPIAYEKTVSLKVETLMLIGKATESFGNYVAAININKKEIDKAYEYAKGKPQNELIIRQWEILKDPDRNLVGGFYNHWGKSDMLSAVMVKESMKLISSAFDQIIGLESGLIKEK